MAGGGRTLSSYLSNLYFCLLFIILQLGCFVFSSSRPDSTRTKAKKRKSFRSGGGGSNEDDCDSGYPSTSSISSRLSRPSKKLVTTSWSFLKRVFSSSSSSTLTQTNPFTSSRETTTDPFSSPNLIIPYSTNSSRSSNFSDIDHSISKYEFNSNVNTHTFPRKRRGSRTNYSNFSSYDGNHPPPLVRNNDIHPCSSCGEIFYRANHLEQHKSIHHAVSELHDGDPGKNIVWIIFKTGWPEPKTLNLQSQYDYPLTRIPNIYRILKIRNSARILAGFEEYRESVMKKAGVKLNNDGSVMNERCVVDGNELLRFYCTTLVCGLSMNGEEAVCGHQYCSLCGIIKSGFSMKLDGILTSGTSWGAHLAVPGDVEMEFGFMSVKRAMLVCRVVAGRVGYKPEKGEPEFDSVVGGGEGGKSSGGLLSGGDEELVVFNPRAVLPCFVIVYSM